MSIQSEMKRLERAMQRIATLELQVEAGIRAIDQGRAVRCDSESRVREVGEGGRRMVR